MQVKTICLGRNQVRVEYLSPLFTILHHVCLLMVECNPTDATSICVTHQCLLWMRHRPRPTLLRPPSAPLAFTHLLLLLLLLLIPASLFLPTNHTNPTPCPSLIPTSVRVRDEEARSRFRLRSLSSFLHSLLRLLLFRPEFNPSRPSAARPRDRPSTSTHTHPSSEGRLTPDPL